MCILCGANELTALSYDDALYWHCQRCDFCFREPGQRLSPAHERERYNLHEPGDERYLKFVEPLVRQIVSRTAPGARGLDFGAGQHPVLSEHLKHLGFAMTCYDPFFWPAAVDGPFDFIVSCEVVEHLYDPRAEFLKLRRWLRPGGSLFIMTDLFTNEDTFATWYYRRDPTHVSFYSTRSLAWIREHLNFSHCDVEGRVAVLSRSETMQEVTP